jgi:hypothetical protein
LSNSNIHDDHEAIENEEPEYDTEDEEDDNSGDEHEPELPDDDEEQDDEDVNTDGPSHEAIAHSSHLEKASLHPAPSLLQKALANVNQENGIRAESINITEDFQSFLAILPGLKDIAVNSYAVYKAAQSAKSWTDLTPLVETDVKTVLNTFKVRANEDFIDYIVQAALGTVQQWAPIGAYNGQAETPVKMPSVTAKALEPFPTEEEAGVSFDVAAEVINAAGYRIITEELYQKLRASHKIVRSLQGQVAPVKKSEGDLKAKGHIIPQGKIESGTVFNNPSHKKKHPSK